MNAERPLPPTPPTPIFRVPCGVVQSFRILTNQVTTWSTHWTTRSRPCIGAERCPACFTGLQARWLGYVAVQNVDGARGLLELSAETIDDWKRSITDLFGCVVSVSRRSRYSGTRLGDVQRQLEVKGEPVSVAIMDDRLCRIWGLPRMERYPSIEEWHEAVARAAEAQLRIDLNQPWAKDYTTN